jgi:hypothetical protein
VKDQASNPLQTGKITLLYIIFLAVTTRNFIHKNVGFWETRK